MTLRYGKPFGGLFLLTAVLVIVPLVGFSGYSQLTFERELLPELDKKALTVGLLVNSKIERALGYGIPFGELSGMSEFFAPVLRDNPDISYLAVTDTAGNLRYQLGLPAEMRQRLASAAAEALGAPADLQAPSYYEPPAFLAAIVGRRFTEYRTHARQLGSFHNTALPIKQGTTTVGVLHVGADEQFAAQQGRDILFDIVIVFLVALLVAFELLMLVVTLSFFEPMRWMQIVLWQIASGDFGYKPGLHTRDQLGRFGQLLDALVDRMNQAYAKLLAQPLGSAQGRWQTALDRLQQTFTFTAEGQPRVYHRPVLLGIRAATLLFMFAEEIARPFLPLYVRGFAAPFAGLHPDFFISLPLSAFMLGVALTMPFAGVWCERVGYRRAFLGGALLSTTGLVGTAFAFSFYDLIGWRVCAAVGYATMFAACQGYVVAKTTPDKRAQGVAMFVGGIMVAAICGPAIGGILADRIGYSLTLLIGAFLAATAAGLAYSLLEAGDQPAGAAWRTRAADFKAVLRNPRFLILMLSAAVPAKLLLGGFLFFLVPLLLTSFGDSQSSVGRVVMMYGLANILLMNLCARFADRWNAHGFMVGSGGLLAGIGMIPVIFFANNLSVVAAVTMLGIGQAMSISPQLALVTQVCSRQIVESGQGPVLGLYRLIERLGGAMGPFLAAGLASRYGYLGAATALGVFGVLTATIFSVAFLVLGVVPEVDDDDLPEPLGEEGTP